jgi:D-alanine-D-alanine ligase
VSPADSQALDVAVLAGGRSTERDVSLASGAAIVAALESLGPARVRVTSAHWRVDGDFEIGGDRLATGAALTRLARFDAVLLAVHGGEGENGTLQGLLELGRVAYSGSGVAASVLGMDKHTTRLVARSLGVRVATGALVRRARVGRAAELSLPAEVLASSSAGFFVKDRFGGSSLGTRFCPSAAELPATIAAVLSDAQDAVVEARVLGTEVTAAVIENAREGSRAWPIVEVAPKAGAFFDYEQKYSAEGASEFCPPRNMPQAVQARVADAARRMYDALDCRGVARIDFIVPTAPDDEPVLLEVNTLPGMTPRSLVPLAARAVGLSYPELCLELARLAAARRPRG